MALVATLGPVSAASTAPTRTMGDGTRAAAQADPITDLAWQLDYDVDRIFRFVSDEIRYEPYVGILRGAAGTLKVRAGNSVDKALLLGALLDASLVPYRFARGRLDESAAAGIMTSITTDAATARSIGREAVARDLDELTRADLPAPGASGAPAGQATTRLQEIEADARERLTVAQGRFEQTVSTIESALRGAGIHLPADRVSLPPAEVADHTWVQARFGSTWRDLDPTMTGAEADTTLATASETVDRLPDDLRYRIEFKVDVEHVAGGQLVTDEVLDHPVFADEVAGMPITFGHVTPSALKKLGVTIGGLFGGGWLDYRPTLDLGATAAVADAAVAIPIGTGADIVSGGGSASPGVGPVDGEATAEWLEVRVTPPGAEPEIARRTVFDRLPADLRAAGRLDPAAIRPIELVDAEGNGERAYLPMLGGRTFAITTGATSSTDIVATADDDGAMVALAFGGLREPLVESLVLDADARTFVSGPNIVSVTLEVLEVGQAPAVGIGLDIWHRDHGVLPLMASSTTAAEARLRKGVADHITERYLTDGLALAAGSDAQPSGVGAVFEAAAAQGIPIRVLHDSMPDPLPIGPLATALIAGALDDGDVVIVPAEPVTIDGTEHIGWWRVDPVTGAATDVMDGGAGTSMVEQAKIYGEQTRWRWVLCSVGAAVIAVTIAAKISMGGLTPELGEYARYLGPGGYRGVTCRVI
jgi:transglutaminase-like putative cysteine protease